MACGGFVGRVFDQRLRAIPPPASFSRTVSNGSESVTVDFVSHPIRSANFGVLVQNAEGTFKAFTPRG
jgi:hypothetical protein